VRREDAAPSAPAAPPEPPPRRPPDLVEGHYELADGPARLAPPRGPVPERLLKPSEYELALAGRGRTPTPPEDPWTSGVWLFPLAAAHRGPWGTVALGFALTGFLVRMMVSFTPG
jgi:hypothetical protein